MSQHQLFELSIPVNELDHALGPAHAAVTLVEYGDFECPICKQAAPAVKLMLKHFAGKLRVVLRHFPQEEVHTHALHAALAAEAAGGQGKFWPMHDLLFDNQSHLKLQHLRGYAEQLELDIVRFDADMEDGLYLQRIREHIEGGTLSGVRATPTFFINGRIYDASFGMQTLMDGIDGALRAAPPSHR
ncbi:MAG TPA: DsbA family protein [Burkholderiales bacterium]|nr:DsbA family protein [Burkholderiales bacterium]